MWKATTCLLLALASVPATGLASPAENGRITLLEEDDSLYSSSDKHYTQGFRLSYLSPEEAGEGGWAAPFRWLGMERGPAGQQAWRHALFFGQALFTPKGIALGTPNPNDRSYAGWLYVGASLMQETGGNVLDTLETQVGVVGPWALGEQLQNRVHRLIGIGTANGWSYQLRNEPGLTLSYERRWRLPLLGDGNGVLDVDVVPAVGATVGNVFTYAAAGGLLRVGRNLGRDYGPVRIRPALSGSDYFNDKVSEGPAGFYIFIGAQGRAVGHNIFLDGNTFRGGPSVETNVLVADLQAGVSVAWANGLRFDLSVVRRTPEFKGQVGSDVIGTAAVGFTW
jgi:hypothetical protein